MPGRATSYKLETNYFTEPVNSFELKNNTVNK